MTIKSKKWDKSHFLVEQVKVAKENRLQSFYLRMWCACPSVWFAALLTRLGGTNGRRWTGNLFDPTPLANNKRFQQWHF